MQKPVLAYLGLGLMGFPMTRRLLAAGYQVQVWNRSKEKLTPALTQGTMAADSPRAAVEKADIVLMCLFDAKAVEQVVFGPEGIAAAVGAGKVLVDHASIHPGRTREFAQRLKEANGMQWIDAPVSGGVKGAAEGTLAIVGADRFVGQAGVTTAHRYPGGLTRATANTGGAIPDFAHCAGHCAVLPAARH